MVVFPPELRHNKTVAKTMGGGAGGEESLYIPRNVWHHSSIFSYKYSASLQNEPLVEVEQRMSGCRRCVLRSAICILKRRKLVFSEHFPHGEIPVTFLGEGKERTEKEQTTTAPYAKRA